MNARVAPPPIDDDMPSANPEHAEYIAGLLRELAEPEPYAPPAMPTHVTWAAAWELYALGVSHGRHEGREEMRAVVAAAMEACL